jgi:SAM-dependent methyltransferase
METIIKTFEQLDDFINKCKNREFPENDLQKFLQSYSIDYNSFKELFGGDNPYIEYPFSDEYAKWEHSFFEFLSGKNYSFDNEGIKAEEHSPLSYPWSNLPLYNKITRLQSYINFLTVIGDLNGKRVLEMGCGYGTLAAFLESVGCDYYAIDASNNFVEITKKLIYSEKIKQQIVNKSFYDVPDFNQLFDIIIFESSFHHCGEPLKLLKILYENSSENAKIIFLKEGIADWFDRPWGIVRPEGETILQIRLRGWLELGYRKDFFYELLKKSGWILNSHNTLYFDNIETFIASKHDIDEKSTPQNELVEAEKKEALPDLDLIKDENPTPKVSKMNILNIIKLVKYVLPYGLYRLYQIIKQSLKDSK